MPPKKATASSSAKATASSSTEAQGKAKKTFADYEKAKLERLQPVVDEQKKRDADYKVSSLQKDKTEWVKIIAVHLAAEPAFAKWMKNPQALESILLTHEWLAHVYLPGRYHAYDTPTAWHKGWFSTGGRKLEILQKAKDIFESRIPTTQSAIEGTIVAKPDNSIKTQGRRAALFKVHSTRQKMVHLLKECTDTAFAISTYTKGFAARASTGEASPEMLEAWEELQELEACKEDCRKKLKDSVLNKRGVSMLDELLVNVKPDSTYGNLYDLPGDKFTIADPSSTQATQDTSNDQSGAGDEDELQTIDIDPADPQLDGVYIDFLGNRSLGDEEPTVFTVRTPQDKDWKGLEVSQEITDGAIVDWKQLIALDSECAEWLLEIYQEEVNVSQFILTFRHFEKVIDRPEKCKDAKASATIWINPRYWLMVMQDNLVHIRRIMDVLVTGNMLIDGAKSLPAVQMTLRRMWAVISLSYGIWPEPALLCTIMDWLLEDLASHVVGHVDPKFETLRMREMAEKFQALDATEQESVSGRQADDSALEKEHKARELFAELARFSRGAVIMGVAACSPKIGNKNKDGQKTWYTELIKLNASCGHRTCKEQLQVIVREEAKTQKFSLSVAVDDGRVGFPNERAFVSTNRSFAYSCLYHFLVAVRYHAGLGPFFHYYAHLWHPACRPFRGKQMLIEDLSLMEGRITSQASSQTAELGTIEEE